MNKAFLGIAVAAVVLVGVMLLRGGGEGARTPPPDAKQPVPASSSKNSSDIVLSIVPGAKREAAVVPVLGKVSPLISEIRTARDYKPIFDRLRALGTPTAEERYVLATMLARCAKVTDRKEQPSPYKVDTESKERFAASLSPKAPNRDKRLAAFDLAMRDNCAGFEGIAATEQEIRELIKRAAAEGDPKAQASELTREVDDARRNEKGEVDYMKIAAISDDQIERFKRIVGSGDARALVDVIQVFGWNANVHLRGPDDAPIDSMTLYYAATLAACDLGYPCGPDSPIVAGGCAFQGQCDSADYRDYVLFYQLPPGNAQLVTQYQQQLLRVIRDGDWSYFTFQRGPSPNAVIFRRQ